MTLASCANICSDYEFFGVQGGNECYCGNDDSKFLPTPISEECNRPCSGDSSQICGSSWRMNVYRTVETAQKGECGTQIESITFDRRHAPIAILSANGTGKIQN